MAQKKTKKKIKDRDMKPAEDPKGGHHRRHGHGFSLLLNQKEDPDGIRRL